MHGEACTGRGPWISLLGMTRTFSWLPAALALTLAPACGDDKNSATGTAGETNDGTTGNIDPTDGAGGSSTGPAVGRKA